LGVTGGTIQTAVASNSTAPALSVSPGCLAWRQRVKRFRRCALERVGRDRWFDPNRRRIQQYGSGVERVPRVPSLTATG
jgi:hypothetical protein